MIRMIMRCQDKPYIPDLYLSLLHRLIKIMQRAGIIGVEENAPMTAFNEKSISISVSKSDHLSRLQKRSVPFHPAEQNRSLHLSGHNIAGTAPAVGAPVLTYPYLSHSCRHPSLTHPECRNLFPAHLVRYLNSKERCSLQARSQYFLYVVLFQRPVAVQHVASAGFFRHDRDILVSDAYLGER